MEKTKTKVVPSRTKNAWNVVNTICGGKHKIAQVPYAVSYQGTNFGSTRKLNEKYKQEALEYAEFISNCFNQDYLNGLGQSIRDVGRTSYSDNGLEKYKCDCCDQNGIYITDNFCPSCGGEFVE